MLKEDLTIRLRLLLKIINKIIINRVLEKQSLDVDVVTGAIATSKGILKAIENALKK